MVLALPVGKESKRSTLPGLRLVPFKPPDRLGTVAACLAEINEVGEWRGEIALHAYPSLTRAQVLNDVGS